MKFGGRNQKEEKKRNTASSPYKLNANSLTSILKNQSHNSVLLIFFKTINKYFGY
jgi:hypothetical protein